MSFPAGDIKQQISTDGGGQPRWRKDGKEIYFRTLDNRLMAASLTLGAKIESTVPQPMFAAPNTTRRRAIRCGTCGPRCRTANVF